MGREGGGEGSGEGGGGGLKGLWALGAEVGGEGGSCVLLAVRLRTLQLLSLPPAGAAAATAVAVAVATVAVAVVVAAAAAATALLLSAGGGGEGPGCLWALSAKVLLALEAVVFVGVGPSVLVAGAASPGEIVVAHHCRPWSASGAIPGRLFFHFLALRVVHQVDDDPYGVGGWVGGRVSSARGGGGLVMALVTLSIVREQRWWRASSMHRASMSGMFKSQKCTGW